MIIPLTPTFDQHHDGFGIQNDKPRISWRFHMGQGDCSGWTQIAYDIEIDTVVYHVENSNSVLVPWPAKPLKSRQIAQVRVRCYGSRSNPDSEGAVQPTNWSPPAVVEAGFLHQQDWQAQFVVTPESIYAPDKSLCPIQFRKVFALPRCSIKAARLYISSYGVFEAFLNSTRIGDHCLSPGWSSYRHRLHYEVFDVAKLLKCTSDNVLTVEVGAGWYASALAWLGGRRYRYGNKLGVLAQLEVDTDHGIHQICSDESWTYSRMCIVSSELYSGEVWDLRILSADVEESHVPETPHCRWHSVAVAEPSSANITASESPPVRVIQVLSPVKIFKTKSAKTILDFGQNLVGRLRVKHMKMSSGSRVTFQHAEVMEDGELGTRPLRTARNTDTITFGKSEVQNWAPKFTFHGFRFVQVDGWNENDEVPLTLDSLVAEVMHTDLRRTGHFECSHPMLNKLHENAVWSMRGNFLSLPTDCPQRDERLGWTGDIAVFVPSATFLFDVIGMLGEWLKDLAAEQAEPGRSGIPPLVVPGVIEKEEQDDIWWPIVPQAIWGDATILVPWSLYESSEDKEVLRYQDESMRTWLTQGIQRGNDRLWDEGVWQLGDWLDPTAPPDDPGNSRTDGTLVADAYLVYVTQLYERIAEILGITLHQEHDSYFLLLQAFRDKYVTKKGLLVGDTQTALALAIHFDLVEKRHRANVAARLAREVKKSQFRIATGFAGTPILCHALTRSGQPELAYRMILNKALPSWMYPIEQGATTIWERWDSLLPDGRVNPGEMTSFNHYALGSVIHWLHEYVGGISPLRPGWQEIKVQPVPGGTVTAATVSFEGPYGQVRCSWKLEGEIFKMNLFVPPNSKAYVILPRSHGITDEELDRQYNSGQWVASGEHRFWCECNLPVWPPKAILPPFWDQTQPEHV